MSLVVCGGVAAWRRHVMVCQGQCQRRRRVVSAWPESPYHGPRFTCCACGDSWADGWLHERPFARGWRQEATRKARARWAEAKAGPVVRDEEFYVISDVEVAS